MIFARPNRRRSSFTIGGFMLLIAACAVASWLARPSPEPPKASTYFIGSFW